MLLPYDDGSSIPIEYVKSKTSYCTIVSEEMNHREQLKYRISTTVITQLPYPKQTPNDGSLAGYGRKKDEGKEKSEDIHECLLTSVLCSYIRQITTTCL